MLTLGIDISARVSSVAVDIPLKIGCSKQEGWQLIAPYFPWQLITLHCKFRMLKWRVNLSLASQSAQLIFLIKSLWIPTRVEYRFLEPLQTFPIPRCPSINILNFQTFWIPIILEKCNLSLTWYHLHPYLLSRWAKMRVKNNILPLDRPPRLIRAQMQWCYLHLLLRSPHPLSRDAYFSVQELVVRSADLVLRDISYILNN